MRLSRPTPALMAQYESFWVGRGRRWPGRPRRGIWVVEGETLLCGTGVFLVEGPYLLLEGFATNPSIPLRARHSATQFLLESTRDLTAMLDCTAILTPSQRMQGVNRLATRLGFVVDDTRPIFGVFP